MRQSFNNKVAIVTGAASGIGRSLCIALAEKGAFVAAADINYKGARETGKLIVGKAGDTIVLEVNVSDQEAVDGMIEAVIEKFGRIDYIFNNAAVCVTGEINIISSDDWQRVMDVNYFGLIYGSRAAYKQMIRQGDGHIVNISSMAGFAPFAANAPYTASKYAVAGFTEVLRAEADSYDIYVSLVMPGIVRSEFYEHVKLEGIIRKEYLSRLPSRMVTPENAAKKILRGVAQKKFRIIFPLHARIVWYLQKFFPIVLYLMNKKLANEFRNMHVLDKNVL